MRTLAILSLAALLASSAIADEKGHTIESLKKVLETMGYEVQDLAGGQCQIRVKSGVSDYYLAFAVSGSGKYLWLNQYLGELPAGDLPADRTTRLVEENHRIQPAHFRIWTAEGKRYLYASMPIENREVTPARIRFAIEHLVWSLDQTAGTWNVGPAAWKTTP